ncbi:MAG: zinc ribbon domain-containing protein [Methanomicrobiales archaeon]|nr:zinc ribbon domain-containing protein [Methanomicrobiales archaeon]
MVQAYENDPGNGPEQYLEPGERVLRYSSSVGIKKLSFNACITDKRIFLIDQDEKKPGVISKEFPRDVVMGSHLESPGSPDPFLVLTIRTSADETRTMKIAFVQEGADRTAEIEEWISLLHGRPLKPVKSITRHREFPVTVHKDDLHPSKPPEKPVHQQHEAPDAVDQGTGHHRGTGKAHLRGPDNSPILIARPVIMEEKRPVARQNSGYAPDATEIAFCHHCGKKAPEGANFCPFCGTTLHRPDHTT